MALATPVMTAATLITPYGGQLVNLLVDDDERRALAEYATPLHSIQLSTRNLCDLEMLAVGAFSPLDRFMGKRDYKCVLSESRLSNGLVFPIPVTLPVEPAPEIQVGVDVALRDGNNNLLAIMTIHEIYEWELEHEARRVFGSVDMRHPFIAGMQRLGKVNISGPLKVLQLPADDFRDIRLTPQETRARLGRLGNGNVIAFQTHYSLQYSHEEMTRRAMQEVDGSLLLQPVIGMADSSDNGRVTRVREYNTWIEHYDASDRVTFSLLPLAMRMAGPREAVWHMIIRRNYGANYLIVGRDYAGPGVDSMGSPFYGPYDAQHIAEVYGAEVGVSVMPCREIVDSSGEERSMMYLSKTSTKFISH